MRRPRFDEQDHTLGILAALAAGFTLLALGRWLQLTDEGIVDFGD